MNFFFIEEILLDIIDEKISPIAEELEKINTCDRCDKTFKDKSNFNKHILTHENVQYSCNYCDQQYIIP